jgi:glycosyltransferase involved in cell wall biosynthesis
MVTNIPAPYRERVHECASKLLRGDYHVVYAHELEPDREWKFERGDYSHSFLKKQFLTYRGRYIHFNFSIINELDRLNPEIVVTTGFNPVFLFAFLWTVLKKRQHVCMTDGWLRSEANLSVFHRWVRKFIYAHSHAFIGASKHSLDLYRSYGCTEPALFQSHLCADNETFAAFKENKKRYDFVFSGRFIPSKHPLFIAEVVREISKKKADTNILIMGSGPLKEDLLECLEEWKVNYSYVGFVNQTELPRHYSSARILLFPTTQECWGVVANEACSVGVPVMTCEQAGVAGDLIIHNHNGFVLPLDVETWARHALLLLTDAKLYSKMSANSIAKVKEYNFENAAQGISDAVRYAETNKKTIQKGQ